MAIGDIGHWRDSAGLQIPGTTYAGFNFASQQRNDNTTYSKPNDSTIEIEEAGDYLIWGHLVGTDASNGRHNPQARLNLTTGSGNLFSSSCTGYSRNNNNNDWSVHFFGIYRNGAVNDQIQIQVRRDTDAPTTGSTANASDVQIVRLGDGYNYGFYQSTSSVALGGTTPNDVSFQTTVFESDTAAIEIQVNDTDIRIKGDNKRYLIAYSVSGDGAGSRTQRISRLVTGATEIDASRSYLYQRNTNNMFGGLGAMVLHETATADEDISVQVYRGDGILANEGGADIDGSWVNTAGVTTACVVIELPDTVEVFASVDGTGGQDIAGGVTSTINATRTVNFNDAASFTRVDDTQMDCTIAQDALVWGNIVTARATTATNVRLTLGARIEIDGVDQTTGVHKCYTRGNQGTQDTFGGSWHPGAIFAFTAGQNVEIETFDDGDNGADDTTRANEVGMFAINLDTLEAAAGEVSDIPLGDWDYGALVPNAVTTENNTSGLAAGTWTRTGNAPNALVTDIVNIPVGTQALVGLVPVAETTENITSVLPAGANIFSGQVLIVVGTENNSSGLVTGSQNYGGLSPASATTESHFSVLGIGNLAHTGLVPQVETSEENVSAPPTGSGIFSGLIPSGITTDDNFSDAPFGIQNYTDIIPAAVNTESRFSTLGTGSHVLVGLVPQIQTTENIQSSNPGGSHIWAGNVPSVISTEGEASTLSPEAQLYTGIAPQTVSTEFKFSTLAAGNHVLTGLNPAVDTTENVASATPLGAHGYTGNIVQVISSEGDVSALPGGLHLYDGNAPTATNTENRFSQGLVGAHVLVGLALQVNVTESNSAELVGDSQSWAEQIPQTITSEGEASALPVNAQSYAGLAPSIEVTEDRQSQLPIESFAHTGNITQVIAQNNRFSMAPAGTVIFTEALPQAVTTEGDASQIPSGSYLYNGSVTSQVTTEDRTAQLVTGTQTITGLVPFIERTGDPIVPRKPRIYKVIADGQ